MTTYPPTRLSSKLVIAAVTAVLGLGILELVAGGMTHPDPDALAVRRQVIALEADLSQQLRDLERGEVRYAVSTVHEFH